MQVFKFGGTSVGSASAIKSILEIVKKACQTQPTILVLSAMSGITDKLLLTAQLASQNDASYLTILKAIEDKHFEAIEALYPIDNRSHVITNVKVLFNELETLLEGIRMLGEISLRTQDKVVSFGEILSTTMIHPLTKYFCPNALWVDARRLIKTDAHFTAAIVDFEKTSHNINDFITHNPADLYVTPGFIASTEDNYTTTLGRGGSDYTAAIFAYAVHATAVEIWSDVSGMLTADPRIVPAAKKIEKIPYHEALELSYFGAKVIYPPTILPVMRKNIPVYLKNTFVPEDPGTLIQSEACDNPNIIRGISSYRDVSVLNLQGVGMIGIPGFSSRFFTVLGKNKINIILITQSSSEQSICVVINKRDCNKAKSLLEIEFKFEFEQNILNALQIEADQSIVAIIGDKMKNHSGISGRMFSALGRNGINVRAIAQGASEMNISAVIKNTDITKALNVLHEEFFEQVPKRLNIFIVGKGNVGKKLLELIAQQYQYLFEHLNINIKLVGLSGTNRFVIKPEGISLDSWESEFETFAKQGSIQDFMNDIIQLNLLNSVFIDITAHQDVAKVYPELLKKSIAIIACNKIACSNDYEHYKLLKSLTREFNTSFYFETNVGAGLPIISTLNDLIKSGDSMHSIQAVLSGTMNFVFNQYDGSTSFADVVKKAQQEGYTEPDPRSDLSGVDVKRKILILAREAGHIIEMCDIEGESFLPPSCFEGSIADFYLELERQEPHFKKLLAAAAAEGAKLKFVARFSNGKAHVSLEHIKPESPLYHLYGKDNIVLFYTNRYPDNPLVIKGAGAGAEVTASGIFADIIKTAHF
ncbi:MAG: bifunctional aspartate kinase/homoserine dehydrogenase I [Alphaproteobacteria bacterium]|nr:bifunctional aspartate kinase/homoserine dehydrogenase I [Alphaproteobacteria bacterium]